MSRWDEIRHSRARIVTAVRWRAARGSFEPCDEAAVAKTFTDELWTLTQLIVWAGTRSRDAVTWLSEINSPHLAVDGLDADGQLTPDQVDRLRDQVSFLGPLWAEEHGFTRAHWEEWRLTAEAELRNGRLGLTDGAHVLVAGECLDLVLRSTFDSPPTVFGLSRPTVQRAAVLAALKPKDESDAATEAARADGPAPETGEYWPSWPTSPPSQRERGNAWRRGNERWGRQGPPRELTDNEIADAISASVSTVRRLIGREK